MSFKKLCELLFSMLQNERISVDIKVKLWLESLGCRFILELGSKNQSSQRLFAKNNMRVRKPLRNFHFSPNDSFKAATRFASVHFN